MGYFIIVGLLFLLPVIITIATRQFEFDMAFLMGLPFGIFGLIPMVILSGVIHTYNADEEYIRERIEMVAINDNVTSSGQFFLGSGSIDSEMSYFYMTKEERGYKIDKVSGSDVYIVEDNGKTPVIEKYDWRFKNKKLEYWFPNWGSGDTIITIPENSILHNYKIDLQ